MWLKWYGACLVSTSSSIEKKGNKSNWPGQLLLFNFKDTSSAMVHAYDPSFLGGRDQEDHGSKPDWANSL
jgi:hypothetical protein